MTCLPAQTETLVPAGSNIRASLQATRHHTAVHARSQEMAAGMLGAMMVAQHGEQSGRTAAGYCTALFCVRTCS